MQRALFVSTLLLLGAAGAYAVIHNPLEGEHGYSVPDPCLMPTTSGCDYTHYMLPAERPASVPESARSTDPDTVLTASPAPIPTPAPREYPPGDTNCDGIVGAADIDVLVCRLSNPNAKPPADGWWYGWSCWGQSDLNRDGEITYGDLELLTAYLGTAQSPR